MERINAKLYNWASILEESTREQALTTALMPFIFPHLALMPDAHLGRGATVGSVIPTLGAMSQVAPRRSPAGLAALMSSGCCGTPSSPPPSASTSAAA